MSTTSIYACIQIICTSTFITKMQNKFSLGSTQKLSKNDCKYDSFRKFCFVSVFFYHKIIPSFFPVICVSICDLKFPFCVNRRPHSRHSKGFSPVCIRTCISNPYLSLKALLQNGHLFTLPNLFNSGNG